MPSLHPYLSGLSSAERVRFALAYPFDCPDTSWCLADGEIRPFDDRAAAAAAEPGRHAVIACGSNGAPAQILRKFGPTGGTVPTIRARLADFATVHAAKFTAYGSMPATLIRQEGAFTTVFVNLLDEAQLERMHRTEALGVEYVFEGLKGLALTLETGGRLAAAASYLSLAGAFSPDDAPLALTAVPQEGPLPRASQEEAQRLAMACLREDGPLEAFIAANQTDPELRAARIARLRAYAIPAR
ncbi:MAG: hypothetical protein HXY25_00500 [Alphaproteobacteria bacterium]|nr:hypothetical protein [Alphaproteobacteria bacterium]